MKFQPLKIGLWLLALVASNALVEFLKLPGRLLVEKYPSVAEWALAIFLAEVLSLIIYVAFIAVKQFLNYKKQMHEEFKRTQELEKCNQILDAQKNDNIRKEELEIVRTRSALARIAK